MRHCKIQDQMSNALILPNYQLPNIAFALLNPAILRALPHAPKKNHCPKPSIQFKNYHEELIDLKAKWKISRNPSMEIENTC